MAKGSHPTGIEINNNNKYKYKYNKWVENKINKMGEMNIKCP
jgi:hypothetical protein